MFLLNTHMRTLLSWSVATVISGTILFRFVENWTWMDALYFSVVTMATVGYGDHVPVTTLGKILTMPYIIVSVALFLMLVNGLSHYFHDYHLKKEHDRRREE
ncbi:MAG: hypothetical protein RI911_577 [Candidatus Parcubacteria bacterium]|jgi:voltage-gated potassium channel Kch